MSANKTQKVNSTRSVMLPLNERKQNALANKIAKLTEDPDARHCNWRVTRAFNAMRRHETLAQVIARVILRAID